MTDRELQEAARQLVEEHATQSEVARRIGIHRSTVSLALGGDSPSRYAKTLKDIIEALTSFRVATERTTVHRVERKE